MNAPSILLGEVPARVTETVYRKIHWRLLPLLVCSFLVAYLDRVNVGFAKLQMMDALKFDDATYGLGAGMFFIGYFVFEVPSNMILRRVGARLWIARIMLTWGVISACMLFVSTPGMFYVLRFLLGVAEAGFSPGILYFLTIWFPARQRGKATGLFLLGAPLAFIVGGPISGYILSEFQNNPPFAAWQWLFLLEAVPAVLLAIVIFFQLDDDVGKAKWLTPEEREWVEADLRAENGKKLECASAGAFLRNRALWVMCFICFCFIMGMYGLAFWVPSLIKRSGVTDPFWIGVYSAIPYVCAAVGTVLSNMSADRTAKRRLHFAIFMFIGAIGLSLSMLANGGPLVTVACLSIAAFGAMPATTLFWALPTATFAGASVAAALAVINSVGNLAGFVSPYVVGWLNVVTKRADVGMYVISIFLLIGGIVALRLPSSVDR